MRNVLSLFDGMSCGQIALIENGMAFDTYYASEIDKTAIKQTQLNFPKTVQLGDVERWREWDVDWSSIDLILAGSPCQGFSKSGKLLAFNDPRSRLYFVFETILRHVQSVNPNVKFLLENVVMPWEYMSVITNRLRLIPQLLNAADLSVQERKRYYWSDIKTRYNEAFHLDETSIPRPQKRSVSIKDIRSEDETTPYIILSTDPEVIASYISGRSARNDIAISVMKHGLRPFFRATNGRGGGTLQSWGRITYLSGKLTTLVCSAKTLIMTEKGVREITASEALSAQCIPAWYRWEATPPQVRRLLGNGWNVAVIQHILKFYKEQI